MKKVLIALVTMTGLVSAQQSAPISLDKVLAAVEEAAKGASSPEAALDSLTNKDAVALGANAKEGDKRAAAKSTTIISGAAALGAVIGAAASKDNRAKGALIGAAVGGAAGYLIERMTNGDKKQTAEEVKPAVEKPAPVQKPDLVEKQAAEPR